MELSKPFHRKKIVVIFLACILIFSGLSARVVYLMVFRAAHYSELALDLHQRERKIKAKRGRILDRNGIVLADNQPVCTISVIHNQIRDPDAVIALLCSKLGLSEGTVRKRVEKVSSIEKIKSNVDLETGEEIYRTGLDGIKVDEDYKRYYPYENLASKVIGFTGGDNQGILALESRYEEVLSGQEGLILEMTDARGVRLLDEGESRVEPVDGKDLYISLDANIQLYAQQLAEQVCLEKEAESVSILVLRPGNGEILAMADVPEYQLNDPFTLPEGQQEQLMTEKEKQEALNKMWRNACINDTYEPGSAFKVITAAAALENGVVREEDSFQCPGYIVVEGRKIRCAKVRGHGTENFVQGTMNSCNPVFVTVGLRMGADTFYQSMKQFGLLNRTGIDVPGEAGTIMHAQDQIGPVELATISFGQSFQITPIQLAATVSSLINGGTRITPHLGLYCEKTDGSERISVQKETEQKRILSEETSARLRSILFQVVENGGGKNGKVEGYQVGGKTATSETLPRGTGRYISSFLGFAPADDPKVLALCIIRNPQGVYYGGLVAAPVVRELFENILPYLDEIGYYEKNETINRN